MARAVRRAGIPLWYTEGFNRHPYITFASPLSLGFESLCESMDIRLVEDMTMDELVRRLNSVLPAGLEVIKAGEPVMKPKEIAFAAYRIAFQNSGFADFMENIKEFLSRQSIEVLKKTKKGDLKKVDLKPALKKAAVSIDDRSVVIEVTAVRRQRHNQPKSFMLGDKRFSQRKKRDRAKTLLRYNACQPVKRRRRPV